MLEAWVAAGLDPARFWKMTPAEFQASLRGAEERNYRALRHAQGLAWTQALVIIQGWHNPKARLDFAKVFPDPKAKVRRVPQTAEQMVAALRLRTVGPKH